MKSSLRNCFFTGIILMLSSFSCAQDSTTVFSNCLADSLNGKERKELAKWIFLSMAAHPSIESYSSISENDRQISNKYVGALITKLLTETCPAEMKKAQKDNPLAIQKAFEFVGQIAMQEIMADEATMKALTGYVQYVDEDAISKIISGK